MEKLRVGIVGCGSIFHYHRKHIASYPQAELVGLADQDEKALRENGAIYGIKNTYTCLEAMIARERTNIIHITTPPHTHAALVEKAIALKNHVFVEKPFTLNANDAVRLLDLAEKNNVRLCVDHNHLFDPWMLQAKAALSNLKQDDIVYVESYYGINVNIPEIMRYRGINQVSWIFDLPGGLFHDFIPHPLYLMLEYTGKPLRIETMIKSYGSLFQNLSDELHVMVEGERAPGKMTISFVAKPFQHFLKVYTKRMIVTVDFNNMTTVLTPLTPLPGAVRKITSNLSAAKQLSTQTISNVYKFVRGTLKPYSGMQQLIHLFYDSILSNAETPVSQVHALDVVEASDTIWKDISNVHPTFNNISPKDSQKGNTKGKVLVTGAAGFLGRRLTERLVESGYSVRVMVRKLSRIDLFQKLGVELRYGDIRDEEQLKNAVMGMDYIVHTAAAQDGDWHTFEKTTIEGTGNVFKYAAEHNIKRIVYISSMSVYQTYGLKKRTSITEEGELERFPEKRGFYTQSKLEADKLAQQLMQDPATNVPAVILRPATIYGPGGPIFTPLIGISAFNKVFAVLGKKHLPLPMVYIDNLIDAIILSLENGNAPGEIFNVIDDECITKRDYIKNHIKKVYPRSYALFFPYWFIYTAVAGQEWLFSRLKKNPFLTRYRLGSSSREVLFDGGKIKQRLGWSSNVPINDGLKRTFQWHVDFS